MSEKTLDILFKAAAKEFEVPLDTLTAETDFFQALGINSFQALNLISKLEDTFDIEIPDYEVQGVKTFAQLAELIEARR